MSILLTNIYPQCLSVIGDDFPDSRGLSWYLICMKRSEMGCGGEVCFGGRKGRSQCACAAHTQAQKHHTRACDVRWGGP